MSDTKKYYYIKLKDNFFDSDQIVIMESMQDGVLYSNILLKLYLKSLKNNGLLMMNEFIPYSVEMIATLTRHPVGVVKQALSIFRQLGLIEILDNGAIFLNDIQLFIGQSSSEGERKKIARMNADKKIKAIGQVSDICPPEIELEIEKELEIDIEKEVNTMHSVTKTKSKSSKKIYGEFKHIRLTDEEYSKLQNDYGNVEELIKHLDEYIEMKGAKYKSHYLAIKKWVVDAVKERKQPKTSRAAKVVEQPVYTKQEEPVEDIDEYLNYAQEFLKGK